MTCIEPVAPDLATKHLVDEKADQGFVDTAESILTMEMSASHCIDHRGKLITQSIEELLHRFLRAHVMPLSIRL